MPINFNFASALADMGGNAAFRFANGARPTGNYLFNAILPEVNRPGYTIESGSMTVRSIMAALAGDDANYPDGSFTTASTFLEKAAKIANSVTLTEAALIQIQTALSQLQVSQGNALEFLQNEALNFLEKVILQGHLDTMEWLRGQALVKGAINWKYGNVHLDVNYGIPAAHMLTKRTGTDAWDGSTSKFWDDVRLLMQLLNYNLRGFIINTDTFRAVINNPENHIEVLSTQQNMATIRRLVGKNFDRPSGDGHETVNFYLYPDEGERIDPSDPNTTIKMPFMPKGFLHAFGNGSASNYRPGDGSTVPAEAQGALGYTHIAPTIEGGGQSGRWARLYTPEAKPMNLIGEGVTRGLPVIEAPELIANASSEIDGA